ncbi:hypothetical protein CBL_02931 [Carabus blaptoides fortunei]
MNYLNLYVKRKKPEIAFSWTKEDLPEIERNISFTPQTNENILLPIEYFTKLFSFDIINDIIDQTNLYSTQVTGTSVNTDAKEMTEFLSILLLMGFIQLPAFGDYCAKGTRIEQIASLMSMKRFKLLRRYIHFNNNDNRTETTKHRYFKIRPLIEKVRSNFRKFHTENEYSIDETMLAYKGTRAGNLRQYIKNKPHKWGCKFFVIAGVSGYILDFIPYQGAITFEELKGSINEINETESSFGVGAGIVIALSKSIHDPKNSVVFFDNYFPGLPLFIYLQDKMNIYSMGTLRANRIAGCPMETDKVLKNQGRGKYDYKVDKDKGLIIVKWVDNKVVLFGSTLYGIKPTGNVRRFSKNTKQKVDVEMDCVAFKAKHTPLKQFRLDIAMALARCGKEPRKGRPSSADSGMVPKIMHPVVERPDNASRAVKQHKENMAQPQGTQYQIATPERFPFATPAEWTRWSRRFERFRIASGLNNKPEEEQVNSLIYLMGDQADDILVSFNLTTEEAKQYETVMRRFKEHFIIRNNILRNCEIRKHAITDCNRAHQGYFCKTWNPRSLVQRQRTSFQSVLTSEFSKFATDYGFEHRTSSPTFPQSNGFAEAAVRIAKARLSKDNDPYRALLAYRSTPLSNGFSPAELLMGRRLRTTLPMATPSLNPKLPDQNLLQQKEKNRIRKHKHDFDQRHGVRTLKPVQPGDRVWITNKRANGVIQSEATTPRSYWVKNTKRRSKTKPSTSYPQHGKPVPGGRRADRARHPGRTTTPNGCRHPQRDLDRHSNHASTSTDERNRIVSNSKRKVRQNTRSDESIKLQHGGQSA